MSLCVMKTLPGKCQEDHLSTYISYDYLGFQLTEHTTKSLTFSFRVKCVFYVTEKQIPPSS